MKRKWFVLLCTLFFSVNAIMAQTVNYTIESAGSGVQGTYLVKVWVSSNSPKISDDDLIYAAVHGVIFRGFSGSQGQPSQRPMVGSENMEQDHAEYFDRFFGKEGYYKKFASIISGSYDRVKVSKVYKIGAILQVNKDNLRRELEQSNIIKNLSSGF